MNFIQRLLRSHFVHYAIIGGTGFVVSEGVLYVFIKLLHLNPYVAGVLGFLCTVTYTWMGNRLFTFRGETATGARGIALEWVKFVGANLIGFAANYTVYSLLLTFAMPPLNSPFLALACGTMTGLIFNFTLSQRLVFRRRSPLDVP